MTFLDWLVWLGLLWAVFLAFCAADVPALVHQLAARYRHGSTR